MLKITELKAKLAAANAEFDAAVKADKTWNSPRTLKAEADYLNAEAAEAAEYYKAQELKKVFYERGDTTTGAGECNARDTFGGHADSELSTEYWQCAIDSVQFMLDCEPSTVLEKDVK